MREEIKKIADFVLEYLRETGKDKSNDVWGPKYRWEHTLRVASWAWRLALEENADVEKCVVAALFHDISHFVSEDYRKHGIRSADVAKDFLLREDRPEDFVEDVAYAIRSHVGEHHPRTVEAKILQDADTIDRFGYFRILLFGKTAELSSLERLKQKAQSTLEYIRKVESGDFARMWTKTGERKLKELVSINKKIHNGILEELDNTEKPEIYFKQQFKSNSTTKRRHET